MDKRTDNLKQGPLFIIGGIVYLIVTIGFFFQLPWAKALWPWPDGRLSYIFIASIAAAIAAPIIWIGLTKEIGTAKGGAINLGVTATGVSIHLFQLYARNQEMYILILAIISAIAVPILVVIFNWSRKYEVRDIRPLPGLIKISFIVFFIVLILTGFNLVRQAPVVFPWPLKPESSVIFGWIFLGAATYFATALSDPKWHSARGQLLGFLAYDLILIGPFLGHLNVVKDEHRLSLIIYIAVLVYSGALAVYYLFINKMTRSWKIQEG